MISATTAAFSLFSVQNPREVFKWARLGSGEEIWSNYLRPKAESHCSNNSSLGALVIRVLNRGTGGLYPEENRNFPEINIR